MHMNTSIYQSTQSISGHTQILGTRMWQTLVKLLLFRTWGSLSWSTWGLFRHAPIIHVEDSGFNWLYTCFHLALDQRVKTWWYNYPMACWESMPLLMSPSWSSHWSPAPSGSNDGWLWQQQGHSQWLVDNEERSDMEGGVFGNNTHVHVCRWCL